MQNLVVTRFEHKYLLTQVQAAQLRQKLEELSGEESTAGNGQGSGSGQGAGAGNGQGSGSGQGTGAGNGQGSGSGQGHRGHWNRE